MRAREEIVLPAESDRAQLEAQAVSFVEDAAISVILIGMVLLVLVQILLRNFMATGIGAMNHIGPDMRIGLDIASLALKRLVFTVVIVTGDSDLVPAMRFARREGLRVLLDTLGSRSVRPELKIHADLVL